jgi:hypothetical protein
MRFTFEKEKGVLITLVLVFGGIFLLLLAGLLSFILLQHRGSIQRVAAQEALHAAEAGIEYYRWHLIHLPNDLQDGTGGPGPYVHSYKDAASIVQGSFSLDIQGTTQCGEVLGAIITSTGWTDDFPNVQRTARVKYVRPSVADFSFLLNANVWAGSDRTITGPYHSNGGIRMDGENRSTVTSARATWTCTSTFGCDPSSTQDGVFTTANGNEALFSFPVPPFDFNGITVDLATIKDLTLPVGQGGQGEGIYLDPAPSGLGYHLVFDGDELDVYDITDLDTIDSYTTENGWGTEDSVILDEDFVQTIPIPASCSVIFAEDHAWVEGDIEGRVTLAVADLINPTGEANVWLPGNITYPVVPSVDDGFVLIAQHDNLISLDSPDDMDLHGIYIAQTGRFGRNHYDCSDYPADCKKNNLDIFGTIVSNERVGTRWACGGSYCSGYNTRTATYDPAQGVFPPPFLPTSSLEFGIRDWEEVE